MYCCEYPKYFNCEINENLIWTHSVTLTVCVSITVSTINAASPVAHTSRLPFYKPQNIQNRRDAAITSFQSAAKVTLSFLNVVRIMVAAKDSLDGNQRFKFVTLLQLHWDFMADPGGDTGTRRSHCSPQGMGHEDQTTCRNQMLS